MRYDVKNFKDAYFIINNLVCGKHIWDSNQIKKNLFGCLLGVPLIAIMDPNSRQPKIEGGQQNHSKDCYLTDCL